MNIHQFTSNQEQAAELAKIIANKIDSVLQLKPQVCIAFSGGKSPIGLFHELNNIDIAWENVTITLVDERFLDPTHPESNENLIRQHLLINKAEKAFFVGLINPKSSILDSVKNANLHIKQIDIAVLGMGEDGHTASIFPCAPELKTVLDPMLTPERYVITTPENANYQRIGLSLSGILDIPQIFISINGKKKLEVLEHASLEPSYQYPISYVLKLHPNYEIFWHY